MKAPRLWKCDRGTGMPVGFVLAAAALLAVGLFVGYVVMAGYYPGGEVRIPLDFLSVAVLLIFVTAAAVTVGPAVAVARTAPAQALRLID